jgi:hypothetical protein
MARLTQTQVAAKAGVSRQAVARALKAGYLVAGRDGRIDTATRTNADWVDLRARLRLDGLGRPLPRRAPPTSGIAGDDIKALLAEVTGAEAAERRRDIEIVASYVAQETVAAVKGELAALRAELLAALRAAEAA